MTSSNDYYDLIAREYESLCKAEPSNALVRAKVEQYFRSSVSRGSVMDFGGGTGLDLPWLSEISERVIFCEPSSGMRQIATRHIRLHPAPNKVVFLDDKNSNILNWTTGVPISEPLDACLANFAVLNNIRNLNLTFQKLGSVIKPGGDLIINVLDASFRMLMRYYPKEYLRSLFSKELVTYTLYNGTMQRIYLHQPGKIKMSANPFFEIKNTVPLKGYGFVLVHLKKR